MQTAKRVNRIGPVYNQTLRDQVTEAIRDAITSGVLKPGERVLEREMAEQVGVSRLPVREAVRQLEHEGLLVSYPRRGTFVAQITDLDILEVFSLREALECLAARLAAARASTEEVQALQMVVDQMREPTARQDYACLFEIDRRLHTLLCTAAHHGRLLKHWNLIYGQWHALDSLTDQVSTLNSLEHDHALVRSLRRFFDIHQALVQAVCSGDSDQAERAMHAHMKYAQQNTLGVIVEGRSREATVEAAGVDRSLRMGRRHTR
jgi:DNA-binding GntR family transcriptional regulator